LMPRCGRRIMPRRGEPQPSTHLLAVVVQAGPVASTWLYPAKRLHATINLTYDMRKTINLTSSITPAQNT
jgi:hypothetical protein